MPLFLSNLVEQQHAMGMLVDARRFSSPPLVEPDIAGGAAPDQPRHGMAPSNVFPTCPKRARELDAERGGEACLATSVLPDGPVGPETR